MRFSAGILAVLALNVFAAEQVFWTLDGSNIGNGNPPAWFGKNLRIESADNGGFTLKSRAQRRLTIHPDSWLVFDLTKAEKQELKNYTDWRVTCQVKKTGSLIGIGSGGNVLLGLYTVPITGLESPQSAAMIIYNYNLDLTFRYMKLVKNPENRLEVIIPGGQKELKPGDKFTIQLTLKDPCEDVSCQLLQGIRLFPLNGSSAVELEQTDDDGRIWKAEITVKNFQSKKKRGVGAYSILVKATVLGGKLDTPIYGVIPAAFSQP